MARTVQGRLLDERSIDGRTDVAVRPARSVTVTRGLRRRGDARSGNCARLACTRRQAGPQLRARPRGRLLSSPLASGCCVQSPAHSPTSVTRTRGSMPIGMRGPWLASDVCNPRAFLARVSFGQAAPKEFAGGGKTVELERKFGTLVAHDGFGTSARARSRIQLGPKPSTIAKAD